jgi:1-acyl-sn-glycerol-3-phosphate acyltransferase
MLDIPICAISTRHFFKFLAKAELVKIPLLGFIIRKLYITVNRNSLRGRVKSYQVMRDEISAGISVWIYPEGTRARTLLPLNSFQEGAFRLANETNTAIAIAAINDSGKHLPSGAIFPFRPGKIDIYWLITVNCNDLNSCKELSYKIISDKLNQLNLSGH